MWGDIQRAAAAVVDSGNDLHYRLCCLLAECDICSEMWPDAIINYIDSTEAAAKDVIGRLQTLKGKINKQKNASDDKK